MLRQELRDGLLVHVMLVYGDLAKPLKRALTIPANALATLLVMLAMLALAAAAVVVESAPDSGGRHGRRKLVQAACRMDDYVELVGGYPARGPAFQRVQPPGKAAAGKIARPLGFAICFRIFRRRTTSAVRPKFRLLGGRAILPAAAF